MTDAALGWKNRITGHGEATPEELMPNPLNWRAHPGLQRSALVGVLNEVGWVQQVVFNKQTGHLIDGHLRVDLARGKGELVPYVEVDLSEEEERLILATLDPLAALATTDQEALDALLSQVVTSDAGLLDLLTKLGGEPVSDGGGLVEGSEYEATTIGFVIEVAVNTPDDRDRVSEAITKLGLTPQIRTVRSAPDEN